MRGPLRRLGDVVSRRIAHEVNKDPRRAPEPAIDLSPPDTYWKYGQIAMLAARYGYTAESLSAAELRVFSQNGEDGVLAEILSRIGVEHRYFLEFGVGDGTQCNTRFLADVLGWSGVYFECNPPEFERLRRRLESRDDITTLQKMVTPENVNELFSEAGVPTEFDVLSIDIDGQDYWVWQAIEGIEPRVVVIEYNSTIPAAERLVEPRGYQWDKSNFVGASLGALEKLAADKGYRLVHTELAGVNAFFVRGDLADPFPRDAVIPRGSNFALTGWGHREYTGNARYVEV